MRCPQCGTELPDAARFCMQCGTPVASKEEEQVSEPELEMCEVKIESKQGTSSTEWRFVAEGVGPRGRYQVAITDWSGKDPENDLDRLVDGLIQDGWEFVEAESSMVGGKFRRLAS